MRDGRDIYRAALQCVTVRIDDPELGVMAVRVDYAVRDWEVGTIPAGCDRVLQMAGEEREGRSALKLIRSQFCNEGRGIDPISAECPLSNFQNGVNYGSSCCSDNGGCMSFRGTRDIGGHMWSECDHDNFIHWCADCGKYEGTIDIGADWLCCDCAVQSPRFEKLLEEQQRKDHMAKVIEKVENGDIDISDRPISTRLFMDKSDFAIETQAINEAEFIEELAAAFHVMAVRQAGITDLKLVFRRFLACSFEIIAKYRGYKSDVLEKRVILSGHVQGDALPLVLVDNSKNAGMLDMSQARRVENVNSEIEKLSRGDVEKGANGKP